MFIIIGKTVFPKLTAFKGKKHFFKVKKSENKWTFNHQNFIAHLDMR